MRIGARRDDRIVEQTPAALLLILQLSKDREISCRFIPRMFLFFWQIGPVLLLFHWVPLLAVELGQIDFALAEKTTVLGPRVFVWVYGLILLRTSLLVPSLDAFDGRDSVAPRLLNMVLDLFQRLLVVQVLRLLLLANVNLNAGLL